MLKIETNQANQLPNLSVESEYGFLNNKYRPPRPIFYLMQMKQPTFSDYYTRSHKKILQMNPNEVTYAYYIYFYYYVSSNMTMTQLIRANELVRGGPFLAPKLTLMID